MKTIRIAGVVILVQLVATAAVIGAVVRSEAPGLGHPSASSLPATRHTPSSPCRIHQAPRPQFVMVGVRASVDRRV